MSTQEQSKDTAAKQKVIQSLEEDDEFEDFQAENWNEQETVGASGEQALWVGGWDDNDADDNFTKELKDELAKVAASKK